jgi:tetratricopeptide (TPR) repeat protein
MSRRENPREPFHCVVVIQLSQNWRGQGETLNFVPMGFESVVRREESPVKRIGVFPAADGLLRFGFGGELVIRGVNQAVLILLDEDDHGRPGFHHQLWHACGKVYRKIRIAIAGAENEFKTAISLDPHYAEAQNNLGTLYGQRGGDAQAEQLFREAIESRPTFANAFVNLGAILASESRFSEAEATLNKALQIDPDNKEAHDLRAMIKARRNE